MLASRNILSLCAIRTDCSCWLTINGAQSQNFYAQVKIIADEKVHSYIMYTSYVFSFYNSLGLYLFFYTGTTFQNKYL